MVLAGNVKKVLKVVWKITVLKNIENPKKLSNIGKTIHDVVLFQKSSSQRFTKITERIRMFPGEFDTFL